MWDLPSFILMLKISYPTCIFHALLGCIFIVSKYFLIFLVACSEGCYLFNIHIQGEVLNICCYFVSLWWVTYFTLVLLNIESFLYGPPMTCLVSAPHTLGMAATGGWDAGTGPSASPGPGLLSAAGSSHVSEQYWLCICEVDRSSFLHLCLDLLQSLVQKKPSERSGLH